MNLTEVHFAGSKAIDGYGPGFFRIGDQRFHGSVLVLPERVQGWGGVEDSAALESLVGVVDVVFVGMGAEIAHLPTALRARLESLGLGVEVMNSPAACRTYNVCLSEGRRVAAALIPV